MILKISASTFAEATNYSNQVQKLVIKKGEWGKEKNKRKGKKRKRKQNWLTELSIN